MVNKAIKAHNLSPTAAAVLGRAMTATTFMANKLDDGQRLSININGKGPIGKVVLAGKAGGIIKGYVENPCINMPLRAKDNKFDVGGAVGKDGYISIIKDLGLKEPYIGKTELVTGEIAEDFAFYFTTSEQQPSAVALGVLLDKTGCKSSGGLFIEPMPNCNQFVITMLEDILRNFTNISQLLYDKDIDVIIDENFGIFNPKVFTPIIPKYECDCNLSTIERVIMTLGRNEAYDIISKDEKVEVSCQFCNTKYQFHKADIDRIFKNIK